MVDSFDGARRGDLVEQVRAELRVDLDRLGELLLRDPLAVGGADASSKATILAQGISEAMNCTAFGLGTAIVNLIAFGLLNNFTSGMIEDINAASVQVLNLVVSNRSKVDLSGVDANA